LKYLQQEELVVEPAGHKKIPRNLVGYLAHKGCNRPTRLFGQYKAQMLHILVDSSERIVVAVAYSVALWEEA
jgi:hypothetical protein